MKDKYLPLRDALVDSRLVSEGNFDHGLSLAKNGDAGVVSVLVRLGYVSERDIANVLSKIYDLEVRSFSTFPDIAPDIGAVSSAFLRRSLAVPIAVSKNELHIVVADPTEEFVIVAFEKFSGKRVHLQIGLLSDIETIISKLYEAESQEASQLTDQGVDHYTGDEDEELLRDLASEAPIIKLVGKIVSNAVQLGASDIHLQPRQDRLAVRYRVDGALFEQPSEARHLGPAITSRIKVMARLNIAEHRLPQDGRARLDIDGRRIDLRVATLPELYGERVVLRILDHGRTFDSLDDVGFSSDTLMRLRKELSRPNGMILVTGPTGSGKSTTLYSALREVISPERNVISVEDPVEYRIDGASQIQVKPKVGLTFSHALRAILRQDPDIIMIGEIRDKETAEIAIHAALTGHLVLSTLHTNTATGAITRLLDMGVEDYLLVSALNAVMSQRLVRKLCVSCRAACSDNTVLLAPVDTRAEAKSVYQAVGCERCQDSGYVDRAAITELIVMNDTLRNCVMKRASSSEIQTAARQSGTKSLREDGMDKVWKGITTVDEVLKFVADE